MTCGRFRVLSSDPERSPMNVSSGGPQPDAFTIRQSSADSDYAVVVRVGEATDFAGTRARDGAFWAVIIARLRPADRTIRAAVRMPSRSALLDSPHATSTGPLTYCEPSWPRSMLNAGHRVVRSVTQGGRCRCLGEGVAVKKRFAFVLIAGVVIVPLSPGVAFGDPSSRPPVGPPAGAEGPPTYDSEDNCPAGAEWREVTPSGPEHLSAAYDHNRDGKVCVRFTPGAIVFMDNVVR
jgi:hypothetical protein